jgi:hypothetical protein
MDSSSQQHQDEQPVSAVAYRWSDKNVFHAISENRMPADKLFDRHHYFAILDKLPVTSGHALLITKHKLATMLVDMPAEAAADTMGDLQVSKAPFSLAGVTAAAAVAAAGAVAAEHAVASATELCVVSMCWGYRVCLWAPHSRCRCSC